MNLKLLVSRGYFCEELPPPFQTDVFGSKCHTVLKYYQSLAKIEKEDIKETGAVRYSIPKVGMHRRQNGIPNPVHQLHLSDVIVSQWMEITKIYQKSTFSVSIPKIDKKGKRAIIQLGRFDLFKDKCIEASFDKFYELKLDISKYFSSIYTHSIPWAIHTKKVAKARRRDNSLLGNMLDKALQYGQFAQTKGIPIGTDTSRIIAEIIGCAIDETFRNKLKKENIEPRGHRFVDDIHFFFSSRQEAETALKIYQTILHEYSLELNEDKTEIKSTPCCFENNWNQIISGSHIRNFKPDIQRSDLKNFVNLLISLSIRYPKDSVIKYGVRRLQSQKIYRSNWGLFEALLYKLAISEPSILPNLLAILLQNKIYVSIKKLQKFISAILDQNIFKANHFEVSWALWFAKTFKIKVPQKNAQQIIDARDVISSLIILDLNHSKLISGKLRLRDLTNEFTKENLTGEYWLLIYEAAYKGWIPKSPISLISFFEKLEKLNIYFYDADLQVEYEKVSNIVFTMSDRKKIKMLVPKAVSEY